jgi:hypothetical protein
MQFPIKPEPIGRKATYCAVLSVGDAQTYLGWSPYELSSEFIVIHPITVQRIWFVSLPPQSGKHQHFSYMVEDSRCILEADDLSQPDRHNIRYYTLPIPLRVAAGKAVRISNQTPLGEYGFIHGVHSRSNYVKFTGTRCGRGSADSTFTLGNLDISAHLEF